MAWTWLQRFGTDFSGYGHWLAQLDGVLWLLTGEQRPNEWWGKIYYSSDGITWDQDMEWQDQTLNAGFPEGGPLFVHQGELHLCCTQHASPYHVAGHSHIYVRRDGSWQYLFGETTDSKFYLGAYSDGQWIVIAGSDRMGTPDRLQIWVWNGSAKTLEYDAAIGGLDSRGNYAIRYNGEWYVQANHTLANPDHIFWRNNFGTWVSIYNSEWYRGHFLASPHGLHSGKLLWRTSGVWEILNFPPGSGIAAMERYGPVIGGDWQDTNVATYNGGSSFSANKGGPTGQYIRDFEVFEGRLFAAGVSNLSRPRVWELVPTTAVYKIGWWSQPTARLIVDDHEFGDTLYLGIYQANGVPLGMKLDPADFAWWGTTFIASAGSHIGVQTADRRDVTYVFGYFGTDDQIQISEDAGITFANADDGWGNDKIATLEYHGSSGSDLIATQYVAQDLLQTLTGTAPWTKLNDIPIFPRSQMRVHDDVWVGSDLPIASPVRMYSGGSWADKSDGLPAIAINDLELGF